jgi:uncharacterized protein YceK
MRLSALLLLVLALGGCATTKRETEAEARAYERGYRRAVQEQYWIIQNQQHQPTAPAANPEKP